MIVLDTNVLIYAVGTEHPLRQPCRDILRAQADGPLAFAVTLEVLQEFAHVRAERRSRADAVELVHHWAEAFDLLVIQRADLDLGMSLFSSHPRLQAFDAVLAAVALNGRAEGLISADPAFADIPGLNWIDPSTPALQALLRS